MPQAMQRNLRRGEYGFTVMGSKRVQAIIAFGSDNPDFRDRPEQIRQ